MTHSHPANSDPLHMALARRAFLHGGARTLGTAALASLLHADCVRGAEDSAKPAPGRGDGVSLAPHFAPKAKRVIYL